MKSYDEYKLDEEVSLIEEGIANFLKGKMMKDKKVATEDGGSINIAADYRASKEGMSKIGALLTDGKYEEALTAVKSFNNDVLKKLAKSLETLVDGQKKVKELKGQQTAAPKNDDDDVDGDELAANAASVKTRKMFFY